MEPATLTALIFIGGLVMAAMMDDKEETTSSKPRKQNNHPEEYSFDYCRDKLRASRYSDYECHNLARQLRRDSDLQYDLEKLQRRGCRFDDAIDELKENGKIEL